MKRSTLSGIPSAAYRGYLFSRSTSTIRTIHLPLDLGVDEFTEFLDRHFQIEGGKFRREPGCLGAVAGEVAADMHDIGRRQAAELQHTVPEQPLERQGVNIPSDRFGRPGQRQRPIQQRRTKGLFLGCIPGRCRGCP